MLTTQTAPFERAPQKMTKALTRALAEARKTAEAIHVLTMDEIAAQGHTLVGRLARAGMLYRGFYTCTLSGVRTLYIRKDADVA